LRFAEEAERFMRPGGDRLVALAGLLAARSLPYSIVKTGEARHLLLRLGRARPRLVFVAHYDRIPGTSGALDNSCACLQLVEFAARQANSRGSAGPGTMAVPSFLIAFTDAEEAPGSGEAYTQGAYSLARKLKAAAKAGEGLAAIVLDVTGRGGRLLLSKAPAELLARTGLSHSPAARGNRFLMKLARASAGRARIAAPLEAALPWSDDLGLTLGGLPALAVSLLPESEAELLAVGRRPPLWKLLHSAADTPELAQESSFALMSDFLDALVLELACAPAGSLY
jgi:hypothetical protein